MYCHLVWKSGSGLPPFPYPDAGARTGQIVLLADPIETDPHQPRPTSDRRWLTTFKSHPETVPSSVAPEERLPVGGEAAAGAYPSQRDPGKGLLRVSPALSRPRTC